jgi:RNA polymerase sigma-70 factor (ECF subfamily)
LPGLVDFRLDPRLRGRLAAPEIVEEIERYLRRHVKAAHTPDRRVLLMWLRSSALGLLDGIHREYLGPRYAEFVQPALLRLDCLPPVSVQQLATELAGPAARFDFMCELSLPLLALQDAFNRLPRSDREILAMRHFERLTREELATILEYSVCRVSHYYLAAIRRLQGELRRHERPAA